MTWFVRISNTENIIINDEKYKQGLLYYLNEMSERSINAYESAQKTNVDINEISNLLTQINYPDQQTIINTFNNHDWNGMFTAYRNLSNWGYSNIPYDSPNKEIFNRVKDLLRQLSNKQQSNVYTKKDAQESFEMLNRQTQANMQQIQQIIANAVQSIQGWSGSSITIEVPTWDANNLNHGFMEPVTGAEVKIGTSATGYAPSFSAFLNEGKLEIDDILEAGEEDFFSDQNSTSDYFLLIRALQNKPNQPAKILTLYTARPSKDRNIYMNATTVPSNIFLTNSYQHAIGLSQEYGNRDIWKVRIDSSHLITTLDGPVKYYQAVGSGPIPVRSMTLVDAVE